MRMFSKLTFSLVFVLLMLALVAGPALAQTMTLSDPLNITSDDTTGAFAKDSFVVFQMQNATQAINGILDDNTNDPVVARTPQSATTFPNVEDLFAFGGTIELLLEKSVTDEDPVPTRTAGSLHQLAITEIMWGTNAGSPAAQWVEVYNEGTALLETDDLRLLFTSNQRKVRKEVTLDNDTAGTRTEVAATTANAVTFTVIDRVSVINRFGARWAPPGQSGRTTAAGDNPVQNLVSMYRKRSTNDEKTAYKYKTNGDPDGDKFADGTDAGQWIASVGRFNMDGNFIGTPGAVQQDDAGQVVSATDPASLPVGSVIINEIFNSAGSAMG